MDFETVDFFDDPSLLADPYPYYEYLRQCPVRQIAAHDLIAVTGYDEVVAVWRDADTYSSCNAFGGPFPGLPVEPEGDDISDLIERYRDVYPISEHLLTFDPPLHGKHRALLMRLLTPNRLKDNEEFIWRLADRQIDAIIGARRCDFISGYADRFSRLNIAGLLGVPESDHHLFEEQLDAHLGGAIGERPEGNIFSFLDDLFTDYVVDRRRSPRDDVLTKLALATYRDGSLPEVVDVVRLSVFLFAAGQGTTVLLLGALIRRVAEDADLQGLLRERRDLIPQCIEETLRLESPVKANFRLARRSTTLGSETVYAGRTVMVMPGAANRDEQRFESPNEFRLDRSNSLEHIAFGRGEHACPGATLARVAARISLERLLDRFSDIRISEALHGPRAERHYEWAPSYILRGLQALHVELTPSSER